MRNRKFISVLLIVLWYTANHTEQPLSCIRLTGGGNPDRL